MLRTHSPYRAAALALLVLPLVVPPSSAEPAHPEAGACKQETNNFDWLTVTCRAPADDGVAAWSFAVSFTQGHDDTRASVEATLEGAPVACMKDDKTLTEGEYGDLRLQCQLRLPPATNGREIAFLVRWSHAEYEKHEVLTGT